MKKHNIQKYSKKIFLIPPFYFYFCIALSIALRFIIPQTNLIALLPRIIIGIPILTCGGYFVMHSFFLFKKSKTPESFQKSLCVVESGLYKYSRNPMYVGFVFILAGIALLLGNIASFISPLLMIAVLNWMFIPYEEEKMEIECREQYLQYKQRVRRWL